MPKLKRGVSLFLVLLILTSVVVSDIANITSVEVHASTHDSNYYRQMLINLAGKMQYSDFEDLGMDDQIDIDSIRSIALFLSNFYVPFSTILDDTEFKSSNTKKSSSSSDSSSEDDASSDDDSSDDDSTPKSNASKQGDTDGYKNQMYNALTTLDIDSELAEVIIKGVCDATLKTAHNVYVKKKDLKHAWSLQFKWDSKNKNFQDGNVGRTDLAVYNLTHTNPCSPAFGQRLKDGNGKSHFLIDNTKFEKYCKSLGTVTADGETYVALSYGMFLYLMQMSMSTNGRDIGKATLWAYNKACDSFQAVEQQVEHSLLGFTWKTTEKVDNPVVTSIKSNYGEVTDASVAVDIVYKIRQNKNKDDNAREFYKAFYNYFSWIVGSGSYTDLNAKYKTNSRNTIEFCWINEGKAIPIFNNGNQCLRSYSMYCDSLNYKNGVGSSVFSVGADECNKLSNKDKMSTFVTEQLIYVDWVGDLILDNKVNRYIMLPGCANPYSLTVLQNKNQKGDKYQNILTPAINLKSISKASEGDLELVEDQPTYQGIKKDDSSEDSSESSSDVSNNSDSKSDDSKSDEEEGEGSGEKSKDYEEDRQNGQSFHIYKQKANVSDGSLYTLKYYRLFYGSDKTNLDNSKKLGDWGNTEKIVGGSESVYKYSGTPFAKDRTLFPNFSILTAYKSDSKTSGNRYYVNSYFKTDGKTFKNMPYFDTLLHMDSITPCSVADADLAMKYKSISDYSGSFNGKVSFNDITKYKEVVDFGDKDLLTDLYLTYAFAEFNSVDAGKTYDPERNVINLMFNKEAFPASDGNIDFSSLGGSYAADKVISLVYFFLHPTKGISYVATWFKNKVSGILLRWHQDIVGNSDSNYTTGMTKYLGMEGYTTLPSLYDIGWISNILNAYTNMIVFLIMGIIIILVCYIIAGELTIQRAIAGLIMFTLLAFIPPFAINATTTLVNRSSDQVYMDKFDYWAYTQLETYANNLGQIEQDYKDKEKGDASEGSTINAQNEDTLKKFELDISSKEAGKGNQNGTGYSGVKLKWMTPKKYLNGLMISKALDSTTAADTSALFLKASVINAVANQSDGQDFIRDDPNALYVYRDYTDIYRYASTSYNLFTTYNLNKYLSQDSNGDKKLRQKFNVNPNNEQNSVGVNWKASGDKTIRDYRGSLADIKTYGDQSLKDLLLANLRDGQSNYGKALSDDLNNTSSLYHVSKGFLVNNFGEESFDSIDGKNYYRRNDTNAVSLLATYANTVGEIQDGYNKLLAFEKQTNLSNTMTYSNLAAENSELLFGVNLGSFSNTVQNFMVLGEEEGFFNTDAEKDSEKMSNYANNNYCAKQYERLGDYYYALYSESPFYYFSFNIQDQAIDEGYIFDNSKRTDSKDTVKKLLLNNNQSYFYNYNQNAAEGYGELRDFMNMHDLFYYIMPMMKPGSDLVREFDDAYGIFTYDDCSLKFTSDGKFKYDNKEFSSLNSDAEETEDDKYKFKDYWVESSGSNSDSESDTFSMSTQQKYEFWHDYNVYSIMQAYAPWYDTLLDCNYAKPTTIKIAGRKFTVENPLDPTCYFSTDDNGKIIEGRYMVFSRSEMNYYGLEWSDLTKVERKIITVQDNVYKEAIHLMDYYTLSDDTLINALAMIELFEFNKEFSQVSPVGSNYELYPTGYELKAFSYDAYLRLIVAESTGEDIATTLTGEDDYNQSIYDRVQGNTSIFFSLFLLLNDLAAVYAIPASRILFLVLIFLMGIVVLVAAVVNLEFNYGSVLWKSFISPLLTFGLVSVILAFVTSAFMSDGASGVTGGNDTINLGDPVMTLMIMFVINTIVISVYIKVLFKLANDMKTMTKAVVSSVSSVVVGAASRVGNAVLGAGGRITGTGENTGSVGSAVGGIKESIGGVGSSIGTAGRAGVNKVKSGVNKLKPKQEENNNASNGKHPTSRDYNSKSANGKANTSTDNKSKDKRKPVKTSDYNNASSGKANTIGKKETSNRPEPIASNPKKVTKSNTNGKNNSTTSSQSVAKKDSVNRVKSDSQAIVKKNTSAPKTTTNVTAKNKK